MPSSLTRLTRLSSTLASLLCFTQVALGITVSRDDIISKRSQTPSSNNAVHQMEPVSLNYDANPGQLVYQMYQGQSQDIPEYMSRHASLQGIPAREYEQLIKSTENDQDVVQPQKSIRKSSRRKDRKLQSQKGVNLDDHAAVRQNGGQVDPPDASPSSTNDTNSEQTLSAGEVASFYGLLGSSFIASSVGGHKLTKYIMGWNDEEATQAAPAEVAMQGAPQAIHQEQNNDNQHVLRKRAGYYTDEGEYIPDADHAASGVQMPSVYGQRSYPNVPLSALRNPVGYIDQYAPIETYEDESMEEPSSSISSRRRKGKKTSRKMLEGEVAYPPPTTNLVGVDPNYQTPGLPASNYIDEAHTNSQSYYTGPPGDRYLANNTPDSHAATAVIGGVLGGALVVGLGAAGIRYVKGRRGRAAAEAADAFPTEAEMVTEQRAPAPPVQQRQPATNQGQAPPPTMQRQAPRPQSQGLPPSQRQQQMPPIQRQAAAPIRAPSRPQHHLNIEDDDQSVYSEELEPEPLQRQRRPEPPSRARGGHYRKRSLMLTEDSRSSSCDIGRRSQSGRMDLFGDC